MSRRGQTYDDLVSAVPVSRPRPAARAALLSARWSARWFVSPLLALLLTACTGGPASDVRVAEVGRDTVTEVVEAPASVVARATATVSAPAAGRVVVLAVADGARVRVGQVLLRIASPTAEQALARAKAADAAAARGGSVSLPATDRGALAQADAAAARAFATARQAAEAIPDPSLRAQALAQVGTAEAQYATARASARRALAQVDAGLGSIERAAQALAAAQRVQTKAAVAAAQATVDSLTVRAPISGTVVLGGVSGGADSGLGDLVGQLPESVQGQAESLLGGSSGGAASVTGVLEVGTPVTAGSVLLTVTDVSSLSLAASVDETDVLLVSPGVPADVELDAVPGATYAATVTSVDLTPTASGRGGVAYVVRLSLGAGTTHDGAAAPQPRPGMSAVAALRVRTAEGVVAVPASAVFREGTRDAVWVVDGGSARLREVRLGAQGEDVVEVVEGLAVGDAVVVRGADVVTEGQRLDGAS